MLLGKAQSTNEEHPTWSKQHDSQTKLDMDKLKAHICWKSWNNQ